MQKIVDKHYCMSSFLTFRCIIDSSKLFQKGMEHPSYSPVAPDKQTPCMTAYDIDRDIKKQLEAIDLTHAAILLSGGMDSAILASYMPKGMKAYTAVCSAQNAVDETQRAKEYCEKNNLEHVVVNVEWKDYLETMDSLMRNDGCPVFANEPQVYRLAQEIKKDGFHTVIFGDSADMVFGGYDKLLSKNWNYEEWKERFTFVDPEKILKDPVSMDHVYAKYRLPGEKIDFVNFMRDIFSISSTGAYTNAFRLAGLNFYDPYAYMKTAEPLDLQRIRSGESKYLIRDLFKIKYPDLEVPEKIAMARAVDKWLADWSGPSREEFKDRIPVKDMTGEQKFMVYSLERFLNLID